MVDRRLLRLISHCMKLIPAILLSAVCLTGCRQVIRPQVEELAGINAFQDGCYQLDISLDLVDDDFVMYYTTQVLTDTSMSEWDGHAVVFWADTYFNQDCHTLYQDGISCKQWRNGWVQTNIESPIDEIMAWQILAAEGEGRCTWDAKAACELDPMLADIQEEVYMVTLQEQSFNWRSLCDVDLDAFFGGNDRLDAFSAADVSLFYRTDDWTLCAVRLVHISDTDYLEATIRIEQAIGNPTFSMDELKMMDGYLSEEWSLSTISE